MIGWALVVALWALGASQTNTSFKQYKKATGESFSPVKEFVVIMLWPLFEAYELFSGKEH